jgi:trans-aconitate methyltransferase
LFYRKRSGWKTYYDAVANRPPRKTLLTALTALKKPGFAIDLGCGNGRDNGELINCFTRSQVENLLQFYAIELLEEEEHQGFTPLGEDRYWHIFHIVARKP